MTEQKKDVQNKAAGLLIVLQSVLYGLGDPLAKSAYTEMAVYSLLSIRYSMAFFLFLLIGRKTIFENLKKYPVKLWLVPSMCIAGCYVLNNLSLQLTAATSVAFIRSLATVLTPLLAFLIYRARYHWLHIPIQGVLLVGLYLLCGAGGVAAFGWGEVLTFISAILGAGALVFSGSALKQIDSITMSTVQSGTAAAMVIVCAFLFDGGISCANAGMQTWGSIFYLAIGCTIGGYLLQNVALKKIPSHAVALLQCICPVMTAIFSYLLLHEKLNTKGMIGAAIILSCVIADTLLEQKQNVRV